jgi:type II secretory pathway component PulF
MILFKYKALNKKGLIVEDFEIGQNYLELRSILKNNGLVLISAKKKKSKIKNPQTNFTMPFLKHLRQLISNNLNLITALDIISQLFANVELKLAVAHIISSIKSGRPLSASLAEFENYFDKLIIKTIEVSEKTSRLGESLAQIIERLETKTELQRKIKSAIKYPIILFCCTICVTLFWLLVVVPKFAELFIDIGVKLPLVTKIVIRISSFLLRYPFELFLGVSAVTVFVLRTFMKKDVRDKLIKKIPILSTIKREIFVMNFFSAIGIMIREKVHLIDGLDCIAGVGDFDQIKEISRNIKKGNSLSNAMKQTNLFSDYELSIITTGEKAGDLWPAFKSGEDMLKLKLSERYQKISSMIQPITIAFIGTILIIIVYAVIVPMYANLEFCA